MSKTALYIPRPGIHYHMMQNGYVDSLRAIGWKVFIVDPKTKLGCQQLIESHEIDLIFTHSRYGIRQLPIDMINDREIAVIVNVLPFGAEEGAHVDEISIFNRIRLVLLHTHLQPDMWSTYLDTWTDAISPLIHLPMAGNIVKSLPANCNPLTDVAMVANLNHRPVITKKLIIPLFQHLDILGYSYQIFGNESWNQTGLNYNGILSPDKLARVYATAKVCPNIHTQLQVERETSINERLFTIPLCGGYQVVNSPLATQYLDQYVAVATNTTTFITQTLDAIKGNSHRLTQIRGAVKHVSHKHTYFNRLATIFRKLSWNKCLKRTETMGYNLAVKHCWEIEARLSAVERGVAYGKETI